MNPNYSEFKFPTIKANEWRKIFSSRKTNMNPAIDLINRILKYDPNQRPKPLKALQHNFFDDLRKQDTKLPNG